jgi:acyl transferase domain-containing protein
MKKTLCISNIHVECLHRIYVGIGVTGLLLSLMSINNNMLVPIKHLRTLNPYVATALTDWNRLHGLSANLPMQVSPYVSCSTTSNGNRSGNHFGSTSSFGMSGVNAHALVSSASSHASDLAIPTVRQHAYCQEGMRLFSIHMKSY